MTYEYQHEYGQVFRTGGRSLRASNRGLGRPRDEIIWRFEPERGIVSHAFEVGYTIVNHRYEELEGFLLVVVDWQCPKVSEDSLKYPWHLSYYDGGASQPV